VRTCSVWVRFSAAGADWRLGGSEEAGNGSAPAMPLNFNAPVSICVHGPPAPAESIKAKLACHHHHRHLHPAIPIPSNAAWLPVVAASRDKAIGIWRLVAGPTRQAAALAYEYPMSSRTPTFARTLHKFAMSRLLINSIEPGEPKWSRIRRKEKPSRWASKCSPQVFLIQF